MFLQAVIVTLRMLVFRAGPQDFPYATDRRIEIACIALGLVSMTVVSAVVFPLPVALVAALAVVGSYLFTVRTALRPRKLMNRYAQTLNALLAVNTVFALMLLPVVLKVAPQMIEFYHQMQQDPELMQQPDRWARPDPAASVVIDILFLWQFVVQARIFRAAADTSVAVGMVLVLLLGLVMLGLSFVLTLFAAPFLAHS